VQGNGIVSEINFALEASTQTLVECSQPGRKGTFMDIFRGRKSVGNQRPDGECYFPDPIAIMFEGEAEFRRDLAEQERLRRERHDAVAQAMSRGFALADRLLVEKAAAAGTMSALAAATYRHTDARSAVLMVLIGLYGRETVGSVLTQGRSMWPNSRPWTSPARPTPAMPTCARCWPGPAFGVPAWNSAISGRWSPASLELPPLRRRPAARSANPVWSSSRRSRGSRARVP
jgi:hypothetical protein